MRITLLLADAAQVADGKLYILGGGWSIKSPVPSPMAIAIKIEVPWNETNRKHQWTLQLVTDDGRAVEVDGPDGMMPIEIGGEFEVGRPAGIPEGTPIDNALAIAVGPIPLDGGRRFVWKLSIDGQTREDWQVGFLVQRNAASR